MYQTWKNSNITIDSTGICAIDARLSLNASIDPIYLAQDRFGRVFNATEGIQGQLSLSYYCTGQDPIKAYISKERNPISGNFGGLYFQSGYLKSYSLNCSPNTPVIANADIMFFDGVSGTLTKTMDRATGTKILNFCDALLIDPSNDGQGGGIGRISGINSIQFSFDSEIDPLYLAGDQMPSEIRFGKKEMLASFVVDCYSGDLPITGKPAGIKVNFTHPELAGIVENIGVSGVLFRRELETSVGDLIRARLYVRQGFINDLPGISSVSDLSAAPGATVTVNGSNLGNTTYVAINDRYVGYSASNSSLTLTIPDDVISGDLMITTDAGTVKAGFFTPTFPAITVDKLQTMSGSISGTAFISGSNFYRITDVRFSTTAPGMWTGSSGFQVINSTMIAAPIPVDAAWGPILVMATGRGVSGQSVERFVPIPTIYGFSPASGISGNTIIISGQGFSGVTGVLFNNLPNISPYTSTFTVTQNTGISVTVPTGNVRGYIKLLAQSGISKTSAQTFSPFVSLTGITPLSGRTGTAITLLGHNMFPDIMYSLGNNSYAVTFSNSVTGVFFRTQFANPNFTGLTGLIPYNAKSGIVGINYNAGSTYSSTVSFKLINELPTILGVTPKSGTYSGYIDISGTNFYDISAVKLSGMGVITTITNPTPIASALADVVSFRIPALTPRLTGNLYTVIIETTIGANATGNGLLTILDNPVFSGFTGSFGGTSGAFGDRILVSGQNIYPGSQIFVPYTGLSGESGQAMVDSGSFNSSYSQLTFFVPQSARTGLSNIILYNGVGYASGANFKLINRPTLTGFSPTSGEWATGISISGTFLSNVTGVKIGTGLNASFTIITDTGINLTIPEDSETDYISIYSRAGSSTSTGKLTIYTPLPTLSGFTPTRAFSGDQLILSGSRLHVVDMILFSGGGSQIGFDYRYFTKVGSSGINLFVPPGVESGQITLRTSRGRVTSSQFFELIQPPSISGFFPTFGYHNKPISISGSNLSGNYVWFVSPNSGKFVSGLNQTWVGTTGLSCLVPREITAGPINVSGSGRVWGSSSQTFYPLPTISGFGLATGIISGGQLVLTGVNATQIRDILFLTGSGNFFNIISGSFTIDRTNASGNNIVNQTTGYTLLTATLNSITVDTGRLAIISAYYTGISGVTTFLTSDISNDLSNLISSQNFYLQETAPMLF